MSNHPDPDPSSRRRVRIGGIAIGAGAPVLIAGPCSVEPEYVAQAEALAACGVDGLRAGVYKPRTHPDSFQGMGAEAIPLLREVRRRSGLPLVSEVMCEADAEQLGDVVDAFQVGARNMQNYRLLESLGEIGKPVVLKRGLAATVDEWVSASEYVRRRGNDDVVLCERGIRTFESRTRNTLDVGAVVVVRELTDLPVIVDPSHAAGRRAWIPALARAALAAGADGLLVEAHPAPERAWSDAEQTIDLAACAEIVADVRRHTVLDQRIPPAALAADRERSLAALDRELARLEALRQVLAGSLAAAGAAVAAGCARAATAR